VDTKLLEEAAKFFDDRARADDLMIASATATTSKVVALNIGALHTSAIVNSLAAQGLGVVVVTPMSREDNKGKLTNSQFDRKERKQSVFDDGQIARLLKTLPTAPLHARKKPEPSITEPFCQAKGELYNFVSRLTRHILGPPRPPDGGKPPYGFADDAFRGSFFFIDPHRVRYLDKDKAIVFPIARKDEPAMPIVWVKSTKSDMETAPASSLAQSGIALSATADADRLVALLLAHRDTIKAREKAPTSEADRNLAGGTVDIIQVDLKTVAAVGFDEQAVATAVVALR
jgi:hypothetical protein